MIITGNFIMQSCVKGVQFYTEICMLGLLNTTMWIAELLTTEISRVGLVNTDICTAVLLNTEICIVELLTTKISRVGLVNADICTAGLLNTEIYIME